MTCEQREGWTIFRFEEFMTNVLSQTRRALKSKHAAEISAAG